MTSSYSKGFGRIAFIGNKKLDNLIKKSETRWHTSEQMVKELLIALVNDQDEVGQKIIDTSEFCLEGNIYMRLREHSANNRHSKNRQNKVSNEKQSNFPKRLLK